MSNPDKHKPLSAEELFKLLENKSNEVTDFDDMDDFEKEALEGFSDHGTSQKAKSLTEEINSSISKRVEQTGNGGAKNRIIWFSAAASIALIILISVFFFNQSKQDSENNLALKEVTEDNKPSAGAEQNASETVAKEKDNVNAEEGKEQETTKPQAIVNTKNAEEPTSSGLITEPSMAVSENKLSSLSGEIGSKDESKNRRENDLDALQKQAVVLTDKTDVKKKEKNSVEQAEVTTGYAPNQNVTTTSTNEESDKNYKLDEANDFKKTKKLEQASQEKAVSTKSNDNSISYSKTAPAPSSASTAEMNNSAYYTGGELAIKEFVVSYLKSKQSSKLISGKYKIVGKVNVKGELSVSEIKQISLENCNCTDLIKEALNTMNKWHPAIQNGKVAISNVEFILSF